MPYPTIQHMFTPPYASPPTAQPAQGFPIRQNYAQPPPAFGSPVGQTIDKIVPVSFPSSPATSGFAIQRPTKSGPKYFPTDSTDPATAARFNSFAAARKARDEHSDLWRFNGQIVEASVIPDQAPKVSTGWVVVFQSMSGTTYVDRSKGITQNRGEAFTWLDEVEAKSFAGYCGSGWRAVPA